jgi:hypothetical protein
MVDLFHGVVVSATLAGTRYVILIRLVRIYADETLPEVELELLHVLENLLSSSRLRYDCCMQPPSSDDTWIDVGGRPAVPLFDDLRDDDWMDRCASFDAASATSFVRQYVDSTVSIAQAGENSPAQRSEDTRALQAVYELRLTAAFSRELHALSRNGRAMLQSGISFRLINWPGDAASRKGPRIAQAADAVLVASPSARPDLFYQEPAFTAAMTFDFARRFRPIAAQDALFQWFANATLDDFRSADLVQLRAIALGFGLGDDRGDGFVFFDSEGLVFPTTERVAAAARPRSRPTTL